MGIEAKGSYSVAKDKVHETGSFLDGVRVIELADELGEYCGKSSCRVWVQTLSKSNRSVAKKPAVTGRFYNDETHPNRSCVFGTIILASAYCPRSRF